MIASLRGVIQWIDESTLIIDVNGVGYLVHVPSSQEPGAPASGDTVLLHTFLNVRENDISLYGFFTRGQLELFRVLLSVPGVGPRTAIAVISVFSPEALQDAISRGDLSALARVPGIGRKTAQRLLVDLNDRISVGQPQQAGVGITRADDDAMNALTALGYSIAEAQQALSQVSKEVTALDERIVAALRYFGNR